MNDATRRWINGGVVTLKILAIIALLKPILVRHASKAVTVFEQAFPGLPSTPDHPRSYTYFSGFHVLDFSDIKWGLLVGVTVYLVALAIQFTVARRTSPTRIFEGPETS